MDRPSAPVVGLDAISDNPPRHYRAQDTCSSAGAIPKNLRVNSLHGLGALLSKPAMVLRYGLPPTLFGMMNLKRLASPLNAINPAAPPRAHISQIIPVTNSEMLLTHSDR
jgi:hypothetical protein